MPEEKSPSNKIMYRVEKISLDLDTLTLAEHVTVCNMLNQMLQFRVTEFQKAEVEAAQKVKAAADLEAKFDPRPPARSLLPVHD